MSSAAYFETRILSADPIELVQILYEHAILAVADARRHLAAGDIAARSKAVSKCVAILGELTGSLNHEAGGALSQELERLYKFAEAQLTLGNLEQKDAPFASVEAILRTLAEGWNGLRASAIAEVREIRPAEPSGERWGGSAPPEYESPYAAHTWCA